MFGTAYVRLLRIGRPDEKCLTKKVVQGFFLKNFVREAACCASHHPCETFEFVCLNRAMYLVVGVPTVTGSKKRRGDYY